MQDLDAMIAEIDQAIQTTQIEDVQVTDRQTQQATNQFYDWLADVLVKAEDAMGELASKGTPGRVTAELIGTIKSYRTESWYDYFYA